MDNYILSSWVIGMPRLGFTSNMIMSILVQLRLVPINIDDQADCKDFR